MKNHNSFETWCRDRLRELDMNIKTLSEAMGYSRQGLYKIIQGGTKRMLPETVDKLAKMLKVTPQEISIRRQNKGDFPHQTQKGTHTTFIGDITFPDNSLVSPGQTFVKTWRVLNSGDLAWKNMSLKCIDEQFDNFPRKNSLVLRLEPQDNPVEIPDTLPSEMVDISVRFKAPWFETTLISLWKTVDPNGKYVFPGYRGLSCQVIVTKQVMQNSLPKG